MMNDYDELYHHGILGMKWGIRRFQNADGTLTDAGKKRRKLTSTDGQNTVKDNLIKTAAKSIGKHVVKSSINKAKNKPKSVKEMSDSELNEWLKRYDMEQRYIKATTKSHPILKAGKEIVGNALKNGFQNWANKKVDDWINKDPNSHNLFEKDPSELSDKELTEANKRRASEDLYRQNEQKAKERAVEQTYQDRENERYQEWLRSRQHLHHAGLI